LTISNISSQFIRRIQFQIETKIDLLQELGKTMQPIIIKEFEDTANAKDYVDKKSTSKNTTTVSSEDQWKD